MSLFPAYSVTQDKSEDAEDETVEDSQKEGEQLQWLNNPSFKPEVIQTEDVVELQLPSKETIEDSRDEEYDKNDYKKKKRKKEKKSKYKKKSRKREKSPTPPSSLPVMTGNEEFYVDKNSLRGYLSVETLHRPACPRYHKATSTVIGYERKNMRKPIKRYFAKKSTEMYITEEPVNDTHMPEDEFLQKTKEINRRLCLNPKDVQACIDLVHHQDKMPLKCTKTQMAERKIDIIEKSLIHNSGNELLYKCYIDVLDATYPSFEVSKFLDKLIAKDPTNYVLWSAQIYASQGSMARCNVPDVLKLYETCMQKMYRKSQKDEIMIKLFKNCALFLRQSGLSEQFFALIRLALELNVSADKFAQIQPDEKDQQTLIDYEEVILKSGLPMNEIWLRIEKLRQSYNFLPCPPQTSCTDPQRIVFNEDICYFIFPLSHKENSFPLTVIILKLLKIPFSVGTSLTNRFMFKSENPNEFDSIEDILVVCLYQTTSLLSNSLNFDLTLYELVKEIVSVPTYLNSNIGYEIYMKTLFDVLLLCSECFMEDERKRSIFVLMWLKFHRILLMIEKFSSKLTSEYSKNVKLQVKNLLKKNENRNVLNFYTEYALLEYEFGNVHVAENIFASSISESNENTQRSDLCNAYVTYAEVLLKERNVNKALKVLTAFALDISLDRLEGDTVSDPRKLIALKKLTEKCNDLVFVERNVKVMEIEQYFLPDYLIGLVKIKAYYQILTKEKLEAMAFLENLLRNFVENNHRHTYIRENIFELYLKILQWPDKTCRISNLLIYETTQRAVTEFPENLFILRTCATLDGQPWYKIMNLLKNRDTPLSIFFLMCSAKYRFIKAHTSEIPDEFDHLSSDIDANEATYCNRVSNILRMAVDKSSILRKNSLIWRLYLRSLADMKKSFEVSKNALYSALDECPWNKALYIDGTVYVPQELSQIQDLIIEKQLRIYGLPDELEILRNDSFEVPVS